MLFYPYNLKIYGEFVSDQNIEITFGLDTQTNKHFCIMRDLDVDQLIVRYNGDHNQMLSKFKFNISKNQGVKNEKR